jgi:hypothetical protein
VEARGADDDTGQDRSPDDRDGGADARDAAADLRELQIDARERVLDRWEAEIAARAAELQLLDRVEEEDRERERAWRADERERRRTEADARRDDAIERDIRRRQRDARGAHERASSGSTDGAADAPDSPDAGAVVATALQEDPPLEDKLRVILAAAVAIVPGCAAATVALTTTGRLETAASTAPWAADLDAAQLQAGCGPLPSAAGGGMVSTPDLSSDGRWPSFVGAAHPSATRGVVSVGLVLGGIGSGVLTVYSDVGGHLGAQARRVVDLLAALTAVTMERTLNRLTYEAQAQALQHALASRDVIGQAKGILMEQRATGAPETFEVLREVSQRLNIKVRDVAEHLVAHRRLPDA